VKLTQTTVAKLRLPAGKTDAIFFDDDLPRFGVRLRAGGSSKFVVHYRLNDLQHRVTIGHTATLTLEEARQRARKILVTVDEGGDPQAEKAGKRAAARLLFEGVARQYLESRESSLRPKTLLGYSGDLLRLWKPLHGSALNAVTRPVVAAHLRDIAKDSGDVSHNRARGTLSAMYAWAIGEGLCENNPVIGTNTRDTKPRERVLTDAELAAVWTAAPDNDYGRIVKLLLLTGQRRDEIGGLRWSEVDLNDGLITLPKERTKNGSEHKVPLSGEALRILQGVVAHRDDLVFGLGQNGFSGWSKGKTPLDAACGVQGWTLHDLRRTAATGMADLGVLPHVIEAVLNHVSGHKAGVAGIYNRSTYATEKRAALDRWASHIRVIIAQSEGANVTRLARKA
jgi:integrase